MPLRFEWTQDTAPHDQCYDPYGEWSTGHGQPYDLTRLERKEHPQDFNYAVEFRSFDQKLKPKPGSAQAEGELFRFETSGGKSVHTFNITSLDGEPSAEPGKCLKLRAPLRHRSINTRAESPPDSYDIPSGVDPARAVIIGCIDDGINIAHDRFRCLNADGSFGSRVDFAWIQDGNAVEKKRKPAFGRELLRNEIEAAMNASAGGEDETFTRLQLVDFTRPGNRSLARRLTHGTGILDLATGANSQDATPHAVNQRIVSVQLPALVTVETSGALLNLFLLAGVQYILQRARLISKKLSPAAPLPVIINFSFGIAGGPHDGRHFIERAFDALVEQHKADEHGGDVHIVLPAGNLFLSRGHAAIEGATGGQATVINLPWRVQPDDQTSSYLEVWLPESAGPPEALEVSIRAPGQSGYAAVFASGAASTPMVLHNPDTGAVIARVTLDNPDADLPEKPTSPGRWRVLVALAATASTDPSVAVAPAGIWHVKVSAIIPEGELVQAWIQRDNAPIGYTSPARQSWFDDAAYDRYDDSGDWQLEDNGSAVKRNGTLNGIATGASVIVAGACHYIDHRQSLYSSASGGAMRTPDASAIADTSRQLPGILAAGARTGSTFAINGTSVAAPHITRWLANEIAKPANRSGFDAATFIRHMAEQHEQTLASQNAPPVKPERSGAGRLPVHPDLAWNVTRGN